MNSEQHAGRARASRAARRAGGSRSAARRRTPARSRASVAQHAGGHVAGEDRAPPTSIERKRSMIPPVMSWRR